MNRYKNNGPIPSTKHGILWEVYEKPSGNVFRFRSEDKATDFIAFANRGGAFDGFTPGFMAILTDSLPRKAVFSVTS
jgi:hypothetical protein